MKLRECFICKKFDVLAVCKAEMENNIWRSNCGEVLFREINGTVSELQKEKAKQVAGLFSVLLAQNIVM